MKNKRLLFLFLFILIIVVVLLCFVVKNFISVNKDASTFSDYIPEEEISSEQIRKTIVTLYFVDSNNQIKSEGRFIDSALLLENPYTYITNLLLEGPQSEDLVSCFPENTSLLDAIYKNGILTLDFSDSLLNYSSEEQRLNIIDCLLNTLSELNEVKTIKILINNEYNVNFSDEYTK